MAIATKKASTGPSPELIASPSRSAIEKTRAFGVIGAFYRFMASLTLAMISLFGVATVLAVGTVVEKNYGTRAAQVWVYRSTPFAIVLTFLALNILCAALIRFPWTKRQTGFVITHLGLLILLFGSLISHKYADEGQVGLSEGEKREVNLLKPDHSVFRVRMLDAHSGEPTREFEIPFECPILAWRPPGGQVLTQKGDPFALVLKEYLPASVPRYLHEPDPQGAPMIRLGVLFQPPGAMRATDMFEQDVRDKLPWLIAGKRLGHAAKQVGPAKMTFQVTDSPEALDDFLNPPKDRTRQVARFRYLDRKGEARTYDWNLPEKPGSMTLPESDLTVSFEKTGSIDFDALLRYAKQAEETTGEKDVAIASFKVRKGEGPELPYIGWGGLPAMPNYLDPDAPLGKPAKAKPLVRISYFPPPTDGEGRRGLIEILATAEGKLYQRVYGREGLRLPIGEIQLGQSVPAFGGPNQPMSLTFQVEKYLPKAKEVFTYAPIEMAVGEMDKAIAAARLEMTLDGQTREVWVRRTGEHQPDSEQVSFGRDSYDVAFDLERLPLGFQLQLDDFDVGHNPGTQEASRYVSTVRLTDEEQNLRDEPHVVSMNHPMVHRHWTFYQSNYLPLEDPRSGRPTGQFMSIFQVAYDPGREVKYLGCVVIILGIFTQFYMRAGVFSDGGKRERARAAAKAAKRAKAGGQTLASAEGAPPVAEEAAAVEEL